MCHRRLPLAAAALLGVLGWTALTSATQTPEGDARDAALAWVALVDESRYAESWTEASGAFKRAVTQEQWQGAVSKAREPLTSVTCPRSSPAGTSPVLGLRSSGPFGAY